MTLLLESRRPRMMMLFEHRCRELMDFNGRSDEIGDSFRIIEGCYADDGYEKTVGLKTQDVNKEYDLE